MSDFSNYSEEFLAKPIGESRVYRVYLATYGVARK